MTSNVEGRTQTNSVAFSQVLENAFSTALAREFLNFVCNERLGFGMSREVFRCSFDNSLVIKFEGVGHRFQNVTEMEAWQTVEHTEYSKWFAPCIGISECGRVLLQKYAEPLALLKLPDKVPSFFTDHKHTNWGLYKNHPVAVDYGRNLLMTKGLTSRMSTPFWT